MTIRIGANNYGKQRVRLLRVYRSGDQNHVKELTLGIRFEGDFEMAHTVGDNSKILPTDTMKNTVYALAGKHPVASAEDFSLLLIEHFLKSNRQTTRVIVEAKEDLWARILVGRKEHPAAFVRSGEEKRTALLDATREKTTIRSGLENLTLMKTTQSAFDGFIRDPYTTLKESRDRILATSISADWLYGAGAVDFDAVWEGVRDTLIEVFAEHVSESVQHTLFVMGDAVLGRFDQIREIRLSLPNKHYNLVNLEPFGLDNRGEVFLPTDEPHGLIEATVQRD
jgi:urate oxidase